MHDDITRSLSVIWFVSRILVYNCQCSFPNGTAVIGFLYINNVIEFSSSTEYAMHDKEQDWKHKTKQQNDQMKAPKGEVCITMLA